MSRRWAAPGALYFAAVFATGFVLGVVRTLWVLPRAGPVGAVLIELPVILAVSWGVARALLRRWPLDTPGALAMGAFAFALLMLGEAGISVLLAGRSLAEHLALYARPEHLLGLLGQLVFAALPAWLARRSPGPR